MNRGTRRRAISRAATLTTSSAVAVRSRFEYSRRTALSAGAFRTGISANRPSISAAIAAIFRLLTPYNLFRA